MDPLLLQSETFQEEGGAPGQAARSALGRPRLDPISMLVREAVQNAWDARVERGRATRVVFSVMHEKFSAEEARTLREIVLAERPDNHPLSRQLHTEFGRLILQDRGTVGLTGPAFVDRTPRPEDRFLNFCRMFGRTAHAMGGGTYGFGKGQYFLTSAAATIIVHTRSMEQNRPLERLIGVSLWNANPEGKETGRHWWGVQAAGRAAGKVGPAEGALASRLAAAIGFRPFGDGETGTSIMIVDPRFDAAASAGDVAARCIAESMSIWFWPRMLGGCDDRGTLAFEVSYNQRAVPVPDPVKHVPLRLYADALRNLRDHRAGRTVQPPASVQEIRNSRGQRLGWLSIALAPTQPRDRHQISRIENHQFRDQIGEDGRGATHHVAMIRAPGQVIYYERCRVYPEETLEYAGLFVAADAADVEEAFAQSEPPSHDDWSTNDMPDEQQRQIVRVALREVETIANAFADAGRPDLGMLEQDPLGAVSAELGELISAPGTGARRVPRGGGGGGGGGRVASGLAVTGPGRLQSLDGVVVLAVPFQVGGDVTVSARPRVLVAGGGAESDAPRGGESPTVVGWRRAGGAVIRSAALSLGPSDGGDWEALIGVPGDVVVGVTLELS